MITRQRFQERFSGGLDTAIVISPDGKARRMDNKPLSSYDRAILAGKDPLESNVQALEPTARPPTR